MEFEDRKSAYPGRYRMIAEDGSVSHVVLERADEPIIAGTPLNAETMNGFLQKSGGTMTGDVFMDGHRLSGLPVPEDGNDAATKTFAQINGVPFKGYLGNYTNGTDPQKAALAPGVYTLDSACTMSGLGAGALVQLGWPEGFAVQFVFNYHGAIFRWRTCWHETWYGWQTVTGS